MFEEQRIKWEGGRGFRICEYWLESGIVETNHKPKAQNRKVGLTESLSEWCHKESLDLQICCVVCFCLLGALAAPRTATIPLSQVLQLFSHQEPTGGASTWMAQLDLFHRVFWWRRGTGAGSWMYLWAEQESAEFWRPKHCAYTCSSSQLQCLRVTPNPLSTLSRTQRIYLTQHHPFPFHTGSPSPVWKKNPTKFSNLK